MRHSLFILLVALLSACDVAPTPSPNKSTGRIQVEEGSGNFGYSIVLDVKTGKRYLVTTVGGGYGVSVTPLIEESK